MPHGHFIPEKFRFSQIFTIFSKYIFQRLRYVFSYFSFISKTKNSSNTFLNAQVLLECVENILMG